MNNFKEKISRNNKSYNNMLKIISPIRTDYLKVYKKLKTNEISVLSAYKGIASSDINQFLYGAIISNFHPLRYSNKLEMNNLNDIIQNKYDRLREYVDILDKILNKYKLKKDTTVFRGFSGELIKKFNKLKINDEITMDSYLSTSFNPSVAYRFTWDRFDEKKKDKIWNLIEIKVPTNTHISYLPWSIENKKKNEIFSNSEFELLIERGCILRLDKISTIEERFFTLDGMNWKKYLNTKNKVKKIKVYNMSIIKINKNEIPSIVDIKKKINWNTIMTPSFINNLYYIPIKKPSYFKNNKPI